MKNNAFVVVLVLAAAVAGCDSVKPEVRCGVVKRTVPGTGGFWGRSEQSAVDLGDRVVSAGGGASLAAGDRACVQLRGEGGPFVTSEGEHK